VNRFVPDNADPSRNVYGAVAGFSWLASERLSINANGGSNWVTGSVSGNGWQATTSASYAYFKDTFNLNLSRKVSPSDNGGFLQSETLIGGWKHELNEYAKLGADASLRRNLAGKTENALGQATDGEKSEVYRFSVWYSRELTDNWNMSASWQHRKTINDTDNINGNILGLTVSYSIEKDK